MPAFRLSSFINTGSTRGNPRRSIIAIAGYYESPDTGHRLGHPAFEGKLDFAAFAANRGIEYESTTNI